MMIEYSVIDSHFSSASRREPSSRVCLRSRARRTGRIGLALGVLLTLLAWVTPVFAQDAGVPTVNDLKAAAYDAQEKARQARASADQAEKAAQSAEASLAAAQAASAAAVAAPAAAAPAAVPPQVLEDLHRATEEAKNAAASARAANAALAEYMQEREHRYSRSGFYLSGGLFYAPQLFDTSYRAENSQGAFGAIGYHFAKRFEVEVRFDGFQDFDLSKSEYTAYYNGFSVTANGKLFILTGSFQPYVGLGIGALNAKTGRTKIADGVTETWQSTVATFRVSAGLDWYLTETIAITGDAAVMLPGGSLSSLNFATLGGGLKLRF
ncbi:MAG: hypothetical protein P8M78_15605 [Myxococcota bacterium]|nr:hypothetical protein [Myxococcota bacterium]